LSLTHNSWIRRVLALIYRAKRILATMKSRWFGTCNSSTHHVNTLPVAVMVVNYQQQRWYCG
jgi:hypothetical protein